MTEEETATVEVIALADAAADLAKGGKRNSKADQAKLNDAHTAIVAAGADCGAMKSDATGDLAKAAEELSTVKGDFAKAQDDLAKSASDLAEALVKIAETETALTAMIKSRDEATTSLIALGKSHETATTERDDLAKRNQSLAADLAAITAKADALKVEIEKLNSAPEPMKGKVLAVAKGEDVSDVSKTAGNAASVSVQAESWFTSRPSIVAHS